MSAPFRTLAFVRIKRIDGANNGAKLLAPSSPALLPRKAVGEGSRSKSCSHQSQ
ncbi:hypothetical protein Mal15_20290 [Stieleria maiorica]|uniref:Uncharacterized protein n=1 Tax=Stieleria maiorica TaxID=2795974 RepID=A0A5B9MB82_9BACT|nr:hypothetical protein Mal15_20290 [Stieleria maiorica]